MDSGILYKLPVRFVEKTAAEIREPSGMIDIPVGQKDPDRKSGDFPYCFIYVAVGKSGIDKKGLIFTGYQKLPHTAVIKNIKMFHKQSRSYQSQIRLLSSLRCVSITDYICAGFHLQ